MMLGFHNFRSALRAPLVSRQAFGRLLSTQTTSAAKQEHQNQNDEAVVQTLFKLGFNNKQINSLVKKVFNSNVSVEATNPDHIEHIFNKYHSNLKKTVATTEWDIENDFSSRVTIHEILAHIEPKLMLAKPKFIDDRFQDLLDLDLINSRADLWRAFVYAPAAFYLQDWGEFMKKYTYLNLRVYEWLYNKHERKNLFPHPLLRFARVFEPSLEHIRARFIFAQRSGLNAISSFSHVPLVKLDKKKVDLGVLILSDLEAYLKLVAPGCKQEEYHTLSSMLEHFEDEDEDMQLQTEIAELNMKPDVERSHAYVTEKINVNEMTTSQRKPSYEIDLGKF